MVLRFSARIAYVVFVVALVGMFSGASLEAKNFEEVLNDIADERVQQAQDQIKVRGKEIDWPGICSASKDAVIQIFSHTNDYPIFAPYKTPDRSGGCGTGFLISDDGYILTNFHVVEEAVVLRVQFPSLGKDNFQVELVGCCPDRDVALLRLVPTALENIKALMGVESLPYLTLGNSDLLGHGDHVLVLGYPQSNLKLGMENLKSSIGDYSGKESLSIGECIQTSTPVNPGNSGGPFFDAAGRVTGMCVLKDFSAEGLAYMIPINNVKLLLKNLAVNKIVRLPQWGLTVIPTTAGSSKARGFPADGGVAITAVSKGSLFHEHGIEKGDVLYEINGVKLDRYGYMNVAWSKDKTYFEDVLARFDIDTVVPVTIYRDGGLQVINLTITCKRQEAIDWFYPWIDRDLGYEVLAGMVVVELTLNHLEIFKKIEARKTMRSSDFRSPYILRYGATNNRQEPRLFVSEFFPDSQIYKAIHKSDVSEMFDFVISKVNGIPVKTIDDFRNAVRASIGKEFLTVETEGGAFVDLSIEELLKEEDALAATYGFEKSGLMTELEQGFTYDQSSGNLALA